MIDIKLIRENPDNIKEKIATKGYDASVVDTFLRLDKEHRELLSTVENLRRKRRTIAKDRANHEAGKETKVALQNLETLLSQKKEEKTKLLHLIPNLPLNTVPVGKGEKDNKTLRTWGKPTEFNFIPKSHVEIGKNLGVLDMEAGAKVSSSQFYFLKNDLVLLEFALMEYVFKMLMKEGFSAIITPDLAKSKYYLGTGYLPKGNEAQIYTIEGEDLGLIATAEVTIAGLHSNEIISEGSLPIKYIGLSHAFRKEAGAHGRYSHGLYRVHQFTKAEMFIYCTPEESEDMHTHILFLEEKIYQDLNIPYRVLEMCTGDLGAIAAKKYDIEAWMPGRGDYGEVTSTSNCTDYQARNLNIKVRRKNGSTEYMHMLNGTAIAVSRTLIAILENYQRADGTVGVPSILQKYLEKEVIDFK